jgi:hypothetical protein
MGFKMQIYDRDLRHRRRKGVIGKLILLIAFVSVFATSEVYASDVKVTDSKGNVVEVRNVYIDYTEYGFTYTPDHEQVGVRAYQGEGHVTINWEKIESIVIKRKKTDVTPNRFEADVTLKDKRVVGFDLMMDSKQGLNGATDIGDFTIRLENVKNIAVVPPHRDKH